MGDTYRINTCLGPINKYLGPLKRRSSHTAAYLALATLVCTASPLLSAQAGGRDSPLHYSDAVQEPLEKGLAAIALAQQHGTAGTSDSSRLQIEFAFRYYDLVDGWIKRNADPITGNFDSVALQTFLYDWVSRTVTNPHYALSKTVQEDAGAFNTYARQQSDAKVPD